MLIVQVYEKVATMILDVKLSVTKLRGTNPEA